MTANSGVWNSVQLLPGFWRAAREACPVLMPELTRLWRLPLKGSLRGVPDGI